MLRQGTSWYALDKTDLHFRMANEMSITQDFRQLTLNLPANTVPIYLEVKTLKGHNMYSRNNNYNDMSFNPWSKSSSHLRHL